MPELPEVQTVVTTLQPHVPGRMITRVELARSDIVLPADIYLPSLLLGRTITSVTRRGKRIIVALDNSTRFFIHLGMTGRLTLNSVIDRLEPHTHLVLDLNCNARFPRGTPESSKAIGVIQLRFTDPRRFGGVWWLGDASCDQGMGPEPLTVRPKQLADRLGRTTRAIKTALLDQSVLAGLGNIYVDESLFAAGIHPLTPADRLTMDQVAQLNRAIKHVLRKAIRHRGSTLRDYRDANGAAGGFQLRHKVYAREGKPCRTCKTAIERIVLGGRSTHFCPTCQAQTGRARSQKTGARSRAGKIEV